MSSSEEPLCCCESSSPDDAECFRAISSDEEQVELSGNSDSMDESSSEACVVLGADDISEEGVAALGTDSADIASVAQERRSRKRHRARGQPQGDKRPRVETPAPPAVCAEPQSFQECFEWPAKVFQLAQEANIDIYERLGRRSWKLSSHFSGLGTAELALQMLQKSFPPLARSNFQVEIVSVCESSRQLRRVLQERLAGSGCIFGDIEGLLDSINLHELASNAPLTEVRSTILAEAIGRAKMASTSVCSHHGGACRLRGADVDVSGSSCRPWSRLTRGAKGFAHKDGRFLIAWCAVLKASGTPVAIHENVKGFEESTLRCLLGKWYDITTLHVEPAHVGFPFVQRPRSYQVLCLRGSVSTPSLAKTYALLTAGLQKRLPSEWPAWVFRATDAEILAEENSARQKRRLESVSVASSDWRYLLTKAQMENIDEWTKQARAKSRDADSDPALVFDLSQHPRFQGIMCRGGLPTLRRSCTQLWSPSRRRWLLPKELAAVMGFPAYTDLAASAGGQLDEITPKHLRAVGNAMHVGCVGVVLLSVMLSLEWVTASQQGVTPSGRSSPDVAASDSSGEHPDVGQESSLVRQSSSESALEL